MQIYKKKKQESLPNAKVSARQQCVYEAKKCTANAGLLSIKTLSCLKTVLRHVFSVLVLVLKVDVLVLVLVLTPSTKKFAQLSYKRPTATITTTTDSPEAVLAKYVAAINMDDFDADEQPNNVCCERISFANSPVL